MRGGLSITVVRKGKVDKLKPSSAEAARHTISNCVVLPSQTFDADRGTWITVEGYDVHCLAGGIVTPAGSGLPHAVGPDDVTGDDQVEYAGEIWQVYGEPAEFRTSRGVLKSLLVRLRRVS
jgi:hypothetical protein